MGEAASRFTAPAPLNPQKLTPRQLQQLLSHFGLNEVIRFARQTAGRPLYEQCLKHWCFRSMSLHASVCSSVFPLQLSPSKARISLLAFIRVFPGVLQGHAMLLLPTLKEIARQQQVPPHPHGLSFATLSSSSLIAEGRVAPGIMSGRCSKASRRQVEALKSANSIALQEIIDSASSCCSGEAPETDMLLLERMLGRIARTFQPRSLLNDENAHVRTALESIAGVCLTPGQA